MAVMVVHQQVHLRFGRGIEQGVVGLGIRGHHDGALNPGQLLVDLLGDEGHEGVEQPKDGAQEADQDALAVAAGRGVFFSVELGLDEFQVPVAELVPDELVEGVGRQVELVGVQAGRHLFG